MSDILFILVLYRANKEQSQAYNSLKALLDEKTRNELLFVWDNSQNNIMLSGAYNKGLDYAIQNKKKWIVLLDQDTKVTQQYIDSISEISNEYDVYAPLLKNQSGKQLSPVWYDCSKGPFGHLSTKESEKKICSAFNSGVILKADLVKSLGGFNPDFPLDYLDFWLFYKLSKSNAKIKIMNVELQHNLSVESADYTSKERYLLLLSAERKFANILGERSMRYYKYILFLRSMKWFLSGHKYWRETIKALLQ